VPEQEVPVGHVTNGVHVQTWVSTEMGTLLDRYLDPAWRTDEERMDIWQKVDSIPDTELWHTHERRRERLIAFARRRLKEQLSNRGASQSEVNQAEEVLNPEVLTIGFARRFATYKRSTLLFQDLKRLSAILNNPNRQVQIIFAGKAHPHDTPGKDLIRQIVNIARLPEFRHSIVFLENYDMNIARYLVQGVDVWFNTPQRPKEASGTSGMKVIVNGGLNCSILDGWWDEGYSPAVGWAIGNGEEYPEEAWEQQNFIESSAIYNLLEKDIVPLYYQRGRDGLPREWIAKVKNSMRILSPVFSTRRMVQEYTEKYYMPSYSNAAEMTKSKMKNGLEFAAWRENIEKVWSQVRIQQVELPERQIKVGVEVDVIAHVSLGSLSPEDVRVQIYYGGLNTHGEIGVDPGAVDMTPMKGGNGGNGIHRFKGKITYESSGERGLSVRVLPNHPHLTTPFLPGLITWASSG
jgi:starch phosphorylase